MFNLPHQRLMLAIIPVKTKKSNISIFLFLNVKLKYWQERQKQPSIAVLGKRCSENMQQIYRRTPMPKCDFNKVALQLYWNHTSAWAFSCKFTAYFQNIFSEEHLWRTCSVRIKFSQEHFPKTNRLLRFFLIRTL